MLQTTLRSYLASLSNEDLINLSNESSQEVLPIDSSTRQIIEEYFDGSSSYFFMHLMTFRNQILLEMTTRFTSTAIGSLE